MTYQRERDEFITQAAHADIRLDVARLLLRYATTLQRLAEAQCNGDWPYEHGSDTGYKLDTCPECEGQWARVSFKTLRWIDGEKHRTCPDCYTQEKVRQLLAKDAPALRANFQGDPRGAVLSLVPVTAADEDVQSGRIRGIYVPARTR